MYDPNNNPLGPRELLRITGGGRITFGKANERPDMGKKAKWIPVEEIQFFEWPKRRLN